MSKFTIGAMVEYVDDTTVGVNTFCGLDDADEYHGRRLNNSLWRAADEDTRTSALFHATDILNRQDWLGNPISYSQALAWPRKYVPNRLSAHREWNKEGIFDDLDNVYSIQYLPNNKIPEEIKHATAELAHYLLVRADSGKSIDASSTDQLSSLSLGSLSMNFREENDSITDMPPSVYFLIKDFLDSITEGDPSMIGAKSIKIVRH